MHEEEINSLAFSCLNFLATTASAIFSCNQTRWLKKTKNKFYIFVYEFMINKCVFNT